MKAPVGKEGRFKELVETWNDFGKRARKNWSCLSGDDELARKLVGIKIQIHEMHGADKGA
jgi:hypothetical protein